jgi:hypothetical protein
MDRYNLKMWLPIHPDFLNLALAALERQATPDTLEFRKAIHKRTVSPITLLRYTETTAFIFHVSRGRYIARPFLDTFLLPARPFLVLIHVHYNILTMWLPTNSAYLNVLLFALDSHETYQRHLNLGRQCMPILLSYCFLRFDPCADS